MVAINFFQPGSVDINIDFPSEWNELLPEELEAISRIQLTEHALQFQDKALILRNLILIRAKNQRINLPGDLFEQLSVEDAATSGFDLLNFLYEKNELTKQPYAALGTFIGAADDFNSITCGEYEDCEIFFNQFKEEPGEEPLAKLAAVLYRQKDVRYLQWDAKKNSYKAYDIEKVLPQFNKLDGAVLYTIFTWYCGCRLRLPQLFPTAFESEGGNKDEPDFAAFTKCIHGAAGPKNGTREKVRTLPLKELFFDLEQEAIKIKEHKKQVERMKR